jgi:uncharacterized membrane protein
MTAFSLPFIGGEIMGLFFLARVGSPWAVVFLVLIGAANLAFHQLLKAPTLAGRALMDKIEGFRMHLAPQEAGDLALPPPPERKPELFEKYLPFAVALGAEEVWAGRFAQVLEHASSTPGGYRPRWYRGTSRTWHDPATCRSFASSFSSAVSTSSRAPGSSSGGGGGGSSGGGGGGGGGGGW